MSGDIRRLAMRALYPFWHRDECKPAPPVKGVDLTRALNDLKQPVYCCDMCGRVYAEPCQHTLSASTAAGVVTFCRCTACAAEANYREHRWDRGVQ